MKISDFVRLVTSLAPAEVKAARLKACAGAVRTLGVGVFILSIYNPIVYPAVDLPITAQLLAGATAAVLLALSEIVLGYLPNTSPTPEAS